MRCTFLLISVLMLPACQNRQLGDPYWVERDVAWGQPVNGLQLGLARREYEAGKAPGAGQIHLGLKLRNVSASPLKVLWPLKPKFGEPVLPLAGNESVAVVLTYKSPAGEKDLKFTPPNRPILYTIEPGQERLMEVRLSPEDFTLDRFAGGSLLARYENGQGEIDYGSAGERAVSGLWSGRAVSGSVEVK